MVDSFLSIVLLFNHVGKPQRRLVQADKVLCESVLQAIMSSPFLGRLSSPNGMKPVQAGQTA